MPGVTADFTLTFEEFAQGYRLQRRRRRFLSGPPERSHWYGCAWIAGLFLVLLIATVVAIGVTAHSASGPGAGAPAQADSPVVTFLVGLLPWPIAAGVLWLVLGRTIFARRVALRLVLLMIVVGAAISLSGVLSEPAAHAAAPAQSGSSTWLSNLPLLIGLAAVVFFMFDVFRQSVRVAWDGTPILRRPVHFEAGDDCVLLQTPVSRTELTWEAIVSFSEGPTVFLLSLSALTFHVVPKRALDGAQIEALRALLQSRTVDAQRGDAASGFPITPTPVEPVS